MDQKQQNQNPVTRPGEPKSGKSGPQSLASIAGEPCHPAVTGDGNTVTTPVERLPTEPGSKPACDGDGDGSVTLTNSSRHNVTEKPCEFCGELMEVKRPSKRYCSNNCRQKAWLARHPDVAEAKAAAWRERTRQRIEARGGEWIERA